MDAANFSDVSCVEPTVCGLCVLECCGIGGLCVMRCCLCVVILLSTRSLWSVRGGICSEPHGLPSWSVSAGRRLERVGVRVFVGKKTLPGQQLSKHRRRVMLGKDATPASVVANKVDKLCWFCRPVMCRQSCACDANRCQVNISSGQAIRKQAKQNADGHFVSGPCHHSPC